METKVIKKETSPESKVSDKQIIVQDQSVVNFNIESLISQAVQAGTPVEGLERLLAMRKELKAEWAKEQFDKAMAAFQAECPTIEKTKEVKTNSGTLAYKYAPIESIVAQVKNALQENGFSYSTGMKMLEDGVEVAVKVTHKDGHSETTFMTVPLGTKTAVMSQSQVVAAASTFAKRYAFCNAFGILTGDEDNDGDTNKFTASGTIPKATVPLEHRGIAIQSTNKPSRPATEKQKKLIADLMNQKGYKLEDLIDEGFGEGSNPSEVIDFLFAAKPKIVNGQPQPEELPVIQVMSDQQKKEIEEITKEIN